MAYPRKVTQAALRRMEAVMRVRLAPGNLGNRALAAELSLPLVVVNRWMSRIRQSFLTCDHTEETNASSMPKSDGDEHG